ncbi:hypothetical protein [Phenylobacterium montanum]|uniref:DUF2142 domain-containing protein n=1 Tax=Phenylobacterium montanum TaxID=2823693 RepID=A0A975IWP5_9CAUL|nr:hypothetical protein [Caulobacter sp. S6]QUD88591.1 hypothetical protein KCG34_01480 [Caulobacter sp. S6]
MRSERARALAIAAAALAFHVLGAGLIVWFAHFPQSLDEIQHLSFVRAMEAQPSLFPHYEALRTLDPGCLCWGAQPNYLPHPSPYYLLMAPIDRLSGGSFIALRIADVAISTVGVALMLAGGFRLLRGWRPRAVFALFLVLFPKLGLISGIINDDNAALVATGLAFLGLADFHLRGRLVDAAVLGAGLALAGWSKLTTALMVGFTFAFAEALRLKDRSSPPPLYAYATVIAGGAIGALPSLVNLVRYGGFVYFSEARAVPPSQRTPIGLAAYGLTFLRQMVDGWSATGPTPTLLTIALYAVLLLGAAAAALALRERRPEPEAAAWRVAAAAVLALVPTVALQFWFGWMSLVQHGFLDLAQPRYYYGLWPGFALALALMWSWAGPGPVRRVVTAGLAIYLVASSAGYAVIRLYLAGAPAIF